MSWLAAAWGAGVGLGLMTLWAGWRRAELTSPLARWRAGGERRAARAALGAAAGVLTGAATGWPVAAVLAALAVVGLPTLVGDGQRSGERAEAVAAWAEMLRDTLAGAAGLEQAILATAPIAPDPIRPQVAALAARLGHQRLVAALQAFADDLADPTADLVVSALILAARRQAGHLGELLAALGQAARDDALMRLRVQAGRARTRTAVRVVVATTLAMAGGLLVLNRGYLAAYDSGLGQLVLLVVGVCFVGAFVWLARMARLSVPARILGPEAPR